MRWLAAVVVLLAASPVGADAGLPGIRFDARGAIIRLDHLRLSLLDTGDTLSGSLTLELSAYEQSDQELVEPIYLPAGTRVTGFAIRYGGDVFAAHRVAREVARRAYDRMRADGRDPALLELERMTAGEVLDLRVFPITAAEPVTIDLALALPRAPVLELAPNGPIGHLEVIVDGRVLDDVRDVEAVQDYELPAAHGPDWTSDRARPALDEHVSLFVGSDRDATAPPGGHGTGCHLPVVDAIIAPSRDSAIVGRYIKRHRAAIAHCYAQALQRTPGLAGTLVLSFSLLPTGQVQNAEVAGVAPELARCVADQAATWDFPTIAGDGLEVVHYPYQLRPRG